MVLAIVLVFNIREVNMTSFFPDKQKKLLSKRAQVVNQIAETFVNAITWTIKDVSKACVLYYKQKQEKCQSLETIEERFSLIRSQITRFLQDPSIRQSTKTVLQKNLEILERRVNLIIAIDKKNRGKSDSVPQSELNEITQLVSKIKIDEADTNLEYLFDCNLKKLELYRKGIEKATNIIKECLEQIKMLEHDTTMHKSEKDMKISSLNWTIKWKSLSLSIDQTCLSAQKVINSCRNDGIYNLHQLNKLQNLIDLEIKHSDQGNTTTAKVK